MGVELRGLIEYSNATFRYGNKGTGHAARSMLFSDAPEFATYEIKFNVAMLFSDRWFWGKWNWFSADWSYIISLIGFLAL